MISDLETSRKKEGEKQRSNAKVLGREADLFEPTENYYYNKNAGIS